jgi:hypothetical protein
MMFYFVTFRPSEPELFLSLGARDTVQFNYILYYLYLFSIHKLILVKKRLLKNIISG